MAEPAAPVSAAAPDFTKVLDTLQTLIAATTSLKEELTTGKDKAKISELMTQKSALTATLVSQLTELNTALSATAGGGRKPRRSVKKGGSAGSPAVYNIQGLITERHDPYSVTRDPLIAAMTQLHAPFSAGVVGDTVQSSTSDLAPPLVTRMTPMDGMGPVTLTSGGGKKKRAAAPKGKKAAK